MSDIDTMFLHVIQRMKCKFCGHEFDDTEIYTQLYIVSQTANSVNYEVKLHCPCCHSEDVEYIKEPS